MRMRMGRALSTQRVRSTLPRCWQAQKIQAEAKKRLQEECNELEQLGGDGVMRLLHAQLGGWMPAAAERRPRQLPFEMRCPHEQPDTWREFLQAWEEHPLFCWSALPADVTSRGPAAVEPATVAGVAVCWSKETVYWLPFLEGTGSSAGAEGSGLGAGGTGVRRSDGAAVDAEGRTVGSAAEAGDECACKDSSGPPTVESPREAVVRCLGRDQGGKKVCYHATRLIELMARGGVAVRGKLVDVRLMAALLEPSVASASLADLLLMQGEKHRALARAGGGYTSRELCCLQAAQVHAWADEAAEPFFHAKLTAPLTSIFMPLLDASRTLRYLASYAAPAPPSSPVQTATQPPRAALPRATRPTDSVPSHLPGLPLVMTRVRALIDAERARVTAMRRQAREMANAARAARVAAAAEANTELVAHATQAELLPAEAAAELSAGGDAAEAAEADDADVEAAHLAARPAQAATSAVVVDDDEESVDSWALAQMEAALGSVSMLQRAGSHLIRRRGSRRRDAAGAPRTQRQADVVASDVALRRAAAVSPMAALLFAWRECDAAVTALEEMLAACSLPAQAANGRHMTGHHQLGLSHGHTAPDTGSGDGGTDGLDGASAGQWGGADSQRVQHDLMPCACSALLRPTRAGLARVLALATGGGSNSSQSHANQIQAPETEAPETDARAPKSHDSDTHVMRLSAAIRSCVLSPTCKLRGSNPSRAAAALTAHSPWQSTRSDARSFVRRSTPRLLVLRAGRPRCY